MCQLQDNLQLIFYRCSAKSNGLWFLLAIDNDEVVLANQTLPISKSYKLSVMDNVEKNLFKRP